MMNQIKRMAIIPARSGSKGLRDKNIKLLDGKPLMAYTIEAALKSGCFEKVFVSTDSQVYADIAMQYGADASFLRTPENSGDRAGSWDVVREVVGTFESKGLYYDEIMLLQPTSPLRDCDDIQQSIMLLQRKNANAIISVTEMEHSPIWSNTLPEDGCMDNFENMEYINLSRQELPTFYRYNGAIYLLKTMELYEEIMFKKKCFAYIMPKEKSIDIDTEFDFKIAELFLKESKML